jgi:hypothetical protein
MVAIAKERIMVWTRTSSWLAAILAISVVGISPAAQEQQESVPRVSPNVPNLSGRVVAVEETPAAPAARRNQYRTLLKVLEIPDDGKTYGDFCDFGYWTGTSYAGHDELPPGYWVYLAPNWYIFKDDASGAASAQQAPRQWGPEQAAGAPDTWPRSGDLTTAWASRTPDGQPEWLELTYDAPTRPVAVSVYETYNPGAVNRVTGFDANGQEVELWAGSDPTPAGKDKGVSVIAVHPEFGLTRIRVYVDSPKVPGWNEIDAVGLLDDKGVTHWATAATASSTYADVSSAGRTELELRSSSDNLLRLDADTARK